MGEVPDLDRVTGALGGVDGRGSLGYAGPMRIGLYLGRHSGHGGGIGVYVRELLRELPPFLESNPAVEVVLYGAESLPEAPSVGHPRLRHRALRLRTNHRAGLIADQILLPGRFRRDRLDIVHAVANIGILAWRGLQMITVHDLYQGWPLPNPQALRREPVGITQRCYRALFRLQLETIRPRGLHIITDGPKTAAVIRSTFAIPEELITVVPLGIDIAFAQFADMRPTPETCAAWCARRSLMPGYVLLSASLDPRKNFLGSVDAYHEYRERSVDPRPLVIIGHSDATDDLLRADERTARGIRAGWISVLPWIPRDELPSVVYAAGTYLLATVGEGFGFPAAEAIACGTPIVSGPNDSVPENHSLLYPCEPYSRSSIAAALERALRHGGEYTGVALLEHRIALLRRTDRNQIRTMAEAARDTFRCYTAFVDGARSRDLPSKTGQTSVPGEARTETQPIGGSDTPFDVAPASPQHDNLTRTR